MNINKILASARIPLSLMNNRKATVTGQRKVDKPNGAKGFEDTVVYTDLPCRLSSVNLDNSKYTEYNRIDYDAKLFVAHDVVIRAGDSVTVSTPEGDSVEKFEAAKEPFKYVSHVVVLLKRRDLA